MHLGQRVQEQNAEVQNHSFADYGQTVRDMNKSQYINMIENIFLDFLVPNFLVGGAT